jgi:Common central domain of tyrosinase/Polyphenol oxidase middle domain
MSTSDVSRRVFLGAASGGLVLATGALTASAGVDHPIPPQPPADPRVRVNIADLTAAQLATLRAGVAAMAARPTSDPTSWRFQANIHGTTGPRTNPLWKRCEHGTLLFFAWHRGYLYYFERILRKASGDDTFTLPYWDWTTSPTVPIAYRDPADSTNSLFHERDINDGSIIPPQFVVDDLNTALVQTDFGNFSPSLEDSPHGQVHVTVGGDMGSVPTSARDPIFWLHHCNIDRLWNRWLNRNDGRMNPTDSSWLNVQYSYADENGQTVTVRVSDIVNSATLGYRYDDTPNPVVPTDSPAPHAIIAGAAAKHGAAANGHGDSAAPGTVVASSVPSGGPTALPSLPAKSLGFAPATIKLDAPEQSAAPLQSAVRLAHPNRPGRILLDIHGLSVAAVPKFTYDVYLSLPDGEIAPDRLRLHRVGSINFFGKGADADHDHASPTFDQTLDATAVVAHLRELGAWDPKQISITLRPVTVVAPRDKEAAVRARAAASAENAKISYKRVNLRIAP